MDTSDFNFGKLCLDIIVIADPRPDLATTYRVTCIDARTGRTIGSTSLPAGPDGSPPSATVGDVIGLIGGGYRLASIFVEIESERLARQTRRLSYRPRRRDRSWLRRATGAVPFESPLESYFLRSLA